MRVEQKAGAITLHVYTDGSPLWPKLNLQHSNGERAEEIRLTMADLHDLRYCIDRLLAQLPNGCRS